MLGSKLLATTLEDLDFLTLAASRKQLKLCTSYNYVHGLAVAPTETLSHRVPLVSSRHVHDLTFVRTVIAHTVLLFPNTISLWNNLPSSLIPQAHSSTPYHCSYHSLSLCWMYACISSICILEK